jgi:hypothetical protein
VLQVVQVRRLEGIIFSLMLQQIVIASANSIPTKPVAYTKTGAISPQIETIHYDYQWVAPEYKTVIVVEGKCGTRSLEKCSNESY